FTAGVVCVVLGGLVAAVTGPLDLAKGSWAAAYLVLVCGTASCAIGTAQTRLTVRPIPPALARSQAAAWGLGNAAVIAGTLTGLRLMAAAGALLLGAALGIALGLTRGAARALPLRAYRAALFVLLVSVPIGMILAHLRN